MRFSIKFILKNRALHYPLFRKYLVQRICIILGLFMQNTILVYWMYNLTNDVWSIGKLGLFEAIPAIGFSLVSGHFVEQREKKTMLSWCIAAYCVLTAGYVALSWASGANLLTVPVVTNLIYAGFFINGVIRAFLSPSTFSLLGLLVPRKHLANGATWSSTSWQTGAVIGPLLGGMFIALFSVPISLVAVLIIEVIALIGIAGIPRQAIMKKEKEPVLQSLKEGLRFVFRTQIILAALTLDMFAVLFGGATALLPVFARDILKVGEVGYGWLRAAPGFGAIITFFLLAWMPLRKKPGQKLLFSIAGFGIAIIVFGISRNVYLSFAMLLLSGMFDAVSVVVRGVILQLYTPDEMRGRVAAVNTMFISSSNEIGEVESGLAAKWIGTVPAVLFGGCMTLVVVVVMWFAAPAIRTFKLEVKDKTT
ncbi:MAG TPA: MFS transporter [Flavipsychrobacter sp.]|nr:MFS transporter [Flavipsychrobacter sp.]